MVEIDKFIVNLAKKYFGLIEDDRQRCIVEDGAKFIKKCSETGKKYIFPQSIFMKNIYKPYRQFLS